MNADGAGHERYRNARAMEYASFALGIPASYLAVAGEWTATLTAVALGVAVYAMSYFERLAVAARRRRAIDEDR